MQEAKVPDDWFATSSIYSEAACELTREAADGSLSIRAEISLPIDTSRVAFVLSPFSVGKQSYSASFVLRPQVPPVNLTFCYDGDGADECPVFVDVVDNGSWPSEWLDWLRGKVRERLTEEPYSACICQFVLQDFFRFHKVVESSCGTFALVFLNYDDHLSCMLRRATTKHVHVEFDSTVAAIYVTYQNPSQKTDPFVKFVCDALERHWAFFKCPICIDQVPLSKAIHLKPGCGHPYCSDCFQMYVQSLHRELDSKVENPYVCAVPSCRRPMDMNGFLLPLMSEKEKRCYGEWAFRRMKSFTKPPMIVMCPRRRCRSKNIHRSRSNESYVFCNDCGATYCELCLDRVTDDHSVCDQNKAWRISAQYMDNLSPSAKADCDELHPWLKYFAGEMMYSIDNWVRKNASFCPNCRTAIQKVDGCNHMTCTVCHTHYCYECGKEREYNSQPRYRTTTTHQLFTLEYKFCTCNI